MTRTNYSREELISICEQAIVPETEWRNRDTPHSQERVGICWALLKAGCEFEIASHGGQCSTDERTIWLTVKHMTFASFEYGRYGNDEYEIFYLPTPERLKQREGRDWY
jgi:hypothetical protein